MNLCDLLKEVESRCPGGKMPSSYVILDLETTGRDPQQCRAVQYGVCIVKDDAVVDTWSAIMKYPYKIVLSSEAVKIHHITPERMEKEGVPIEEFVPTLVEMLKKARENGVMFMGHNFGAFDRVIIERDSMEFADTFKFGENDFIDSGGLVKAAQLAHVAFRSGESLASFFERVRNIRAKGVRWSLSWCVNEFGLVKEGADTSKLHDAGVDSRVVHLLYRSLLDEMDKECKEC